MKIWCPNTHSCAAKIQDCNLPGIKNYTPEKPFYCNKTGLNVAHRWECPCPDGYTMCESDKKCLRDDLAD